MDAFVMYGKSINWYTISRWSKSLSTASRSNGFVGEFITLNPKSTKPKSFKTSKVPGEFIEYIKVCRKKKFGAGKKKLIVIINSARSDLSYVVSIQAEYSKAFMLYG